jgi:putative transcriptional regulator
VAVKHDPELEQFQNDLMASVREMKAGQATRETRVALSRVAEVRANAGLSQKRFAELLGVSPRTLQQWEQGRREPAGAAKTLLRVAEQHPEVLRELAAAHG